MTQKKLKRKTLKFKSKETYRKFNAYTHIHGVNKKHRKTSKFPTVTIHGKQHKVTH
jgi:hypothetical protein